MGLKLKFAVGSSRVSLSVTITNMSICSHAPVDAFVNVDGGNPEKWSSRTWQRVRDEIDKRIDEPLHRVYLNCMTARGDVQSRAVA